MPRRLPQILVPLAVAAIVAGASSAAWATSQRPAAAAAVKGITVYLAPASKGGSDKHSGLTRSSPVLTLARAQQVLQQQKPTGDVQIRIDQGTYVTGQTRWTFYVPGHSISFMPLNYVLGHGRPPGGDPVFADTGSGGAHTAGWWLQAQEPSSGPLSDGGTTGLRFYYLQIEDYTNGISLDGQAGHSSQSHGMYIKPSEGVNGNSVSGMTFTHIGDLFAPGQTGFGAILLTDSSGNDITNNTFDHIENASSTSDKIHGIYVTHFSSANSITANLFTTVISFAVKVRDRSNFNDVEHNRFNATGGSSAYRDEFCDQACVNANPGTARQCASYGNRFFNNTIGTVFGGTAKQNAWSLSPPGLTYAGGSGCSIPKGQQRLHTGGNT
jgi:hypothetical protein